MRIEGWRTNLTEPTSNARRGVSIAPSNAELLTAPGPGRRVVGVAKRSDYPPRMRSLPNVGGDLHVDVAKVSPLPPDLAGCGEEGRFDRAAVAPA